MVLRNHISQLQRTSETNGRTASCVNPLTGTLYSSTLIRTLAVDGWAVTFRIARRGLGGLRPGPVPPRCTKCNSPPINGQCTNIIRCGTVITYLHSKWLTVRHGCDEDACILTVLRAPCCHLPTILSILSASSKQEEDRNKSTNVLSVTGAG